VVLFFGFGCGIIYVRGRDAEDVVPYGAFGCDVIYAPPYGIFDAISIKRIGDMEFVEPYFGKFL
jgi:hypothetical protein